jgi:hypothetical protein
MRLAFGISLCCLVGLTAASQGAVAGPYVQVDHGLSGAARWRILVWHDVGPGSSNRKCSGIQIREKASAEVSLSAGCGAVEPPAPLLHSVTRGAGKSEVTVFSLVVARAVKRVELNFGPRGTRNLRPELLSNAKAKKAKVPRLRFATFAFRGSLCFRGITEYDQDGRVILTTGKTPCQ